MKVITPIPRRVTRKAGKDSAVHGFDYVLSRMEKLLGYGHVPG